MKKTKLRGGFDSGYTMEVGGAIVINPDYITFEAVDGNDKIKGTGKIDNDGHTMNLTLEDEGLSMKGHWEERDANGRVVYGGDLEFVHDGEKLCGFWTMESAGGEVPKTVNGTWVLTKRLGNKALNS